MTGAELSQRLLRQFRMNLDLVDHRNHIRNREQLFKVILLKIAHTDSVYLSVFIQVCQGLPRLLKGILPRSVNQVKIQIVQSQLLEAVFVCLNRLVIVQIVIPHL